MQCGNIASRTNGTGCIYIQNTYIPNIYIYRQISVFTTSVGLAALAPIILIKKINKINKSIILQYSKNYIKKINKLVRCKASWGEPERASGRMSHEWVTVHV